MGASSGTEERGRAGRHRRTGEPLIRRRDHTAGRPRRRLPFPAPPLSALIGIAVLVLIGAGVIHLSGTGSAIPQEELATPVADSPADGGESAEDGGSGAGTAPEQEGDQGETATGQDAEKAAPGSAPAGSTTEGAGEEPSDAEDGAELVVHVSGAVASPGVVRLPPGARVDDALRAAGGATKEARLDAVNLARPVLDGEQIHVPVPGEEQPPASAADPEQPAAVAGSGGGDAPGGEGIDLNTAGASELEELPGVGPAIAQRIIDHREQNGPFESVDQLEEVSGIGPATLEKLRDKARV